VDASWGSSAGLRRAAILGDGWLASAYNTTPDTFAAALDRLAPAGRPPAHFPHAIATTWLYVTNSTSTADRIVDEVLGPALERPGDQLRAAGLPIGPAEHSPSEFPPTPGRPPDACSSDPSPTNYASSSCSATTSPRTSANFPLDGLAQRGSG
jgi:hypothetical protein